MTGELRPADHSENPVPRGELRVSYEDRDRVAEELRVAAGDGRLTAEELDQRLEVALTARTYAELATVTRDLPSAAGGAPAPKDLVRIESQSSVVERTGPWLVPRRMEVRVKSAHVTLDFTEAVITQPVLPIDAEVGSGMLTLVIKPGIVVDMDDVTVRSGRLEVRAPWGLDASVLRIQVSGKVGSGIIIARPRRPPRAPRPPRRTFWQWLTRQPRPRPAIGR
ncbi:MAG: hypothetical protein QOG05_6168 [Streptosporangiaceae bacterium]|nr:hypothetical protein [Streptosporangiaceae bacterium]